MSNEWLEMLKSDGINADEADFTIMAQVENISEKATQVVDLSGLSVFEISGEDASAFLQGQFCNDLKQVSSTRAQITGYCTPKGRLLALPTVVGFNDGFRLLVPQSVKEAFIKRLTMFVMRSKVAIQELSDVGCLGVVAGADVSADTIKHLVGTVPIAPFDTASSDSLQVIRWHDDHSAGTRARYIVIGGNEILKTVWDTGDGVTRSGQGVWRLGDISANVPSVTGGVVEAFVPQMMNLQLMDGLSFTKGCYPGQEIVARMQYLGKLKRHMRPFKLAMNSNSLSVAPVPGAKLTCGADQEAGVIVDAAQMGDESILILAVVKVSSDDNALSFEDHALVPLPLPYELPSLNSDQPEAG